MGNALILVLKSTYCDPVKRSVYMHRPGRCTDHTYVHIIKLKQV